MSNTSESAITSEDVRQKIQRLEGLPPFPAIASQILMECQKPEVDNRVVANLVECEPAICAKIIQLSNSPMFGASRPIVSISHAIVLLGFTSVSQMAVSIAAGAVFDQGDPSLKEHRKQTFRQSLACAVTSRVLASEIKDAGPDEAFLGGIMHDVGKLVLFDAAAHQYCQMLAEEPSGNTTLAEKAVFGIDHAEVGKKCGAKWGFPAEINRAIEFHHRKPDEINHALSLALMAGNYYSLLWTLGGNQDLIQPEIAGIDDLFGASKLDEIRDVCIDQFEAVIEICAA